MYNKNNWQLLNIERKTFVENDLRIFYISKKSVIGEIFEHTNFERLIYHDFLHFEYPYHPS